MPLSWGHILQRFLFWRKLLLSTPYTNHHAQEGKKPEPTAVVTRWRRIRPTTHSHRKCSEDNFNFWRKNTKPLWNTPCMRKSRFSCPKWRFLRFFLSLCRVKRAALKIIECASPSSLLPPLVARNKEWRRKQEKRGRNRTKRERGRQKRTHPKEKRGKKEGRREGLWVWREICNLAKQQRMA